MSDCLEAQEAMEEIAALGGDEEGLPAALRAHLGECKACREYWEESLELNRLLEEPLALPPANLAELVMARLEETEPPSLVETCLPWAERFAWAASGAVAMFCLERLPEYSTGWIAALGDLWSQSEALFQVPVAASASTLMLAALVLLSVQSALVYGTRKTA